MFDAILFHSQPLISGQGKNPRVPFSGRLRRARRRNDKVHVKAVNGGWSPNPQNRPNAAKQQVFNAANVHMRRARHKHLEKHLEIHLFKEFISFTDGDLAKKSVGLAQIHSHYLEKSP